MQGGEGGRGARAAGRREDEREADAGAERTAPFERGQRQVVAGDAGGLLLGRVERHEIRQRGQQIDDSVGEPATGRLSAAFGAARGDSGDRRSEDRGDDSAETERECAAWHGCEVEGQQGDRPAQRAHSGEQGLEEQVLDGVDVGGERGQQVTAALGAQPGGGATEQAAVYADARRGQVPQHGVVPGQALGVAEAGTAEGEGLNSGDADLEGEQRRARGGGGDQPGRGGGQPDRADGDGGGQGEGEQGRASAAGRRVRRGEMNGLR